MSIRAVQIPARIRKGMGAAPMTFLLAALVCRTPFSQQAGGSAQMIRAQSSLVLVDVIGQNPRAGLPVRDFQQR